MSVIYAARNVTKRFGPVYALDDVDFDVVDGKINGLVGANGAGKSTLLKIIAGALSPDGGELRLDGKPLAMTSIEDAARARDRDRVAGTQSVPRSERRRKPVARARRRRLERAARVRAQRRRGIGKTRRCRHAQEPAAAAAAGGPAASSRSRGRFCKSRACSFSTSRRRRCTPPKCSVCMTSSAACAIPASASSMSATFWKNCWKSRITSSSCATGGASPRRSRRASII